jgi:anti-sigma factor RsiW
MPNLLEQLENNEAILQMYLAEELPADDQAEVDQLLLTDVRLRAELEQLRTEVADNNALFSIADAQSPPPISEAAALRGAMRAMRQWRLTHQKQTVERPAQPGLRFVWWLYPGSAAAMLLLASVIWWGFRQEPIGDHYAGQFPSIVGTAPEGSSVQPTYVEYTYADPLDQAYVELRNIQDLADGL